jgi:predicted DNA-binding transcriptional regulator AlpA
MSQQNTDRILTAQEAADRLRLSTRTLDRIATTESGLRKIQLSLRRVGYRESDVRAFIERGGQVAVAA